MRKKKKISKHKHPLSQKQIAEQIQLAKQPPLKEEVVRVEGLCKKYSKKADYAIENVSFSCYSGEILGLLGHNGAGKSTTLKCLEGMLPYQEGEIFVCGHNIQKEPILAKRNMGFVTDNHAVFVKMTGIEYISFLADVYKVPFEVREQRLEELESVFKLGDAIYNLISSYSHGMRQKICMMGSLIHQPKLWILDEPMTGLDPYTMRAVQNYMRAYVKRGNSIIFSTHSLPTVGNICNRVVVIKKGKQIDTIDVKQKIAENPNFDFEEYFFDNQEN